METQHTFRRAREAARALNRTASERIDRLLLALADAVEAGTEELLAANARRGRERKNYLTEGMCLGLALGAGLSGLLQMELGLAMSLGLLLGAALGQLVPKGEVDKTEEEERDHGED